MKHFAFFVLILAGWQAGLAQNSHELIFPDSTGWNILNENEELSFQVKTSNPEKRVVFTIEGTDNLGIRFDTLGNFYWKPSYDLVDRVSKTKDFTVFFQANWADGRRNRKPITFTVNHVNRPPVVEELPVFYVKQSTHNGYQISSDYVFDPDGDPIVPSTIRQGDLPAHRHRAARARWPAQARRDRRLGGRRDCPSGQVRARGRTLDRRFDPGTCGLAGSAGAAGAG